MRALEALVVAGKAAHVAEGLDLARFALASGRAHDVLDRLVRVSQAAHYAAAG